MISCIANFLIDWYKRFRNSIGIFNALTAWMWITWNDVNILILLSEISTEYFQSVPVVAIVVDVLTIKLYNIVFKGAVANFTNGPFRLPPSGPGWGGGGGVVMGFKCYVKLWEWQIDLGGQTRPYMIEGLAVFPTFQQKCHFQASSLSLPNAQVHNTTGNMRRPGSVVWR